MGKTYSGGGAYQNLSIFAPSSGGGSGSSYVLPIASSSILGGIKVGSGLTIDPETGILTADTQPGTYSLPIASASVLGGIKVGSGLSIDVAGSLSVAVGAGSRPLLAADRTYYVATTGSNSNDGLSSSSPFLTIQKAIDTVVALDLNGFSVTISVAAGTYTDATILKTLTGLGTVTITGAPADLTSVVITTTSACFSGDYAGTYSLQYLKLTTTNAANAIYITGGKLNLINMSFGSCIGGTHIQATGQTAKININGNYTISGAAIRHWWAGNQGTIVVTAASTITISSTWNFGYNFAAAYNLGCIDCYFATFSGSATGVRYYVATNGVIATWTGNANFLPGNSAGSVASGGQYV